MFLHISFNRSAHYFTLLLASFLLFILVQSKCLVGINCCINIIIFQECSFHCIWCRPDHPSPRWNCLWLIPRIHPTACRCLLRLLLLLGLYIILFHSISEVKLHWKQSHTRYPHVASYVKILSLSVAFRSVITFCAQWPGSQMNVSLCSGSQDNRITWLYRSTTLMEAAGQRNR